MQRAGVVPVYRPDALPEGREVALVQDGLDELAGRVHVVWHLHLLCRFLYGFSRCSSSSSSSSIIINLHSIRPGRLSRVGGNAVCWRRRRRLVVPIAVLRLRRRL